MAKKRKIKMTKQNLARWKEGLRLENKQRKQRHEQKLSLDEYLDIIHGKVNTEKKFKPYRYQQTIFQQRSDEERKRYPSKDDSTANPNATAKKESPTYTGDLVKGVATMHKSNAVPIIDQEQATDISRMRR